MLKVSDIESQRMMIRVERGKDNLVRDGSVRAAVASALLETLREYWRWKKMIWNADAVCNAEGVAS